VALARLADENRLSAEHDGVWWPDFDDEIALPGGHTIDDAGITIDAGSGNRIVIGSASGATTIEAASTQATSTSSLSSGRKYVPNPGPMLHPLFAT
jgi:hypothetical protein